ncbi:response regulator transcription factor [Aquimarina sp. RZ0]|uniref:response regulator transcription factor n=1 Tax=Aquimarina sp. RZ0 TaxID=2607730 RepID=UPI0011F2EB41|nr:response regulator transcription factor [Aquimarina sp. RZ0]KAA1245864.1 response regulator transcription factor [Aquimarina sp. RZ0]
MTLTKPIHVLIVDDHQIVIDGIRSLLKSSDAIHIAGEALNGKEALTLLAQKTIDIIILDIEMPIMNGIELTKIIKEQYTDIKVLILTMYDTPEFVQQAIEIEADGYILKNRGSEELELALQTLAGGEEYYGKEANKTLRSGVRKKKNSTSTEVQLTKREIDVLQLIAEGKTTPQIADQLCIAHSTVETHRRNLIEKTQVENATKGLIKFAIKNKYTL